MSTGANVNKPTDIKTKEADVNRKLQIYGIISAFQNGKVPSNDQIDVALSSFLASRALSGRHEKLSSDGQELVKDAANAIKQAKHLLLSKNEGNLIQDFVWQTTQFDAKNVNTPNAPVSKDAAKQDGDQALQGLRTLGQLLITNGQFRKLLSDATVLFRDMAGDAATNAAAKVRPSQEQLEKLDEPAQDNVWHEAPDFSKQNFKNQAKGIYSGNPKEDAKEIASAGINSAAPGQQNQQGSGVPASTGDARDAARQTDPQAGKNAAAEAAQNKLDNKIDPETKESILKKNEEYRNKARNYLDKKMPQERKEQTIWRLKKMILECQQHEDYSEAIQTLLRLAETYSRHTRTVGQGSTDTAKDARGGLHAAERDLRTIIERFANGTSTEDLWEAIGQIYRDADNDRELKDWFKSMDSYIRRCLLQQGYILEDQSTREWDQLYDQGRYLLRNKYRGHTDRIVDEIKFLADQFDQDAQNHAFAQSLQKLFKDLGNDKDGKPVFKPHLLKDLRDVILPAALENIAYIPIPRIEYTDSQFDAIIENLVLESDNFAPNVFEVASEHYFRWGRKKIANKSHQTMEVKVAGIQMDLRDVSFHIKRKQGFPSITDTGVADIVLPGDGFSFKMKVSTADKKDRQNYFKVEKVDVDFAKLQIKVKKSNHKLLFSIFKPFMLKVIRPPLQKAVEKAIKDQCNKLDQLLFQVKQEADRATAEAKNNPEQAPNIYNRYYNAAQQQFTKNKKKAEAVAADKKANIAITKEDSIFPNIDLPGGISTKATEYKELARKGDKWESPVFSIGSAKKSTDIPSAPKIQRKAHPVSQPGPKNTGSEYDFYPAGHGQTGNGALNGNGHHDNGLNGKHIAGNGEGYGLSNTQGLPHGQAPLTGGQTINI
ncbi:Ff.00g075660.m01.CDS01 [Fusarium sp. VM40]|nr:Ff.00g075660.m01.CDS01 [Fusarium sp. VM40]